MTKCDFTYEHYIETLRKAKETHVFYTFADNPEKTSERFIILRHDVDAEMPKALKMAKIDNELGISSTFFVRIHGPYNPFRSPSYEAVLGMKKLGHNIGLHYEPMFFTKYGLPVDEMILFEVELLSRMFSMQVNSIAPHMPSLSILKMTGNSVEKIREKFNDPYLPKFFKDIKYISDSNKRWREGCMCEWIPKSNQIQIAIHPHWWNGESLEEYLEKHQIL